MQLAFDSATPTNARLPRPSPSDILEAIRSNNTPIHSKTLKPFVTSFHPSEPQTIGPSSTKSMSPRKNKPPKSVVFLEENVYFKIGEPGVTSTRIQSNKQLKMTKGILINRSRDASLVNKINEGELQQFNESSPGGDSRVTKTLLKEKPVMSLVTASSRDRKNSRSFNASATPTKTSRLPTLVKYDTYDQSRHGKLDEVSNTKSMLYYNLSSGVNSIDSSPVSSKHDNDELLPHEAKLKIPLAQILSTQSQTRERGYMSQVKEEIFENFEKAPPSRREFTINKTSKMTHFPDQKRDLLWVQTSTLDSRSAKSVPLVKSLSTPMELSQEEKPNAPRNFSVTSEGFNTNSSRAKIAIHIVRCDNSNPHNLTLEKSIEKEASKTSPIESDPKIKIGSMLSSIPIKLLSNMEKTLDRLGVPTMMQNVKDKKLLKKRNSEIDFSFLGDKNRSDKVFSTQKKPNRLPSAFHCIFGKQVMRYNIAEDSYKPLELTHHVQTDRHVYCEVDSEHLFISGGFNKKTCSISPCSYMINILWNSVEILPDMLLGRSQHAVVYHKQQLYVLGGIDSENKVLQSCCIYDIDDRVWYRAPSMKYERKNPQTFVSHVTKCIYVLGGTSLAGKDVGVIEKFDTKKMTWSTLIATISFDFNIKECIVLGNMMREDYYKETGKIEEAYILSRMKSGNEDGFVYSLFSFDFSQDKMFKKNQFSYATKEPIVFGMVRGMEIYLFKKDCFDSAIIYSLDNQWREQSFLNK